MNFLPLYLPILGETDFYFIYSVLFYPIIMLMFSPIIFVVIDVAALWLSSFWQPSWVCQGNIVKGFEQAVS